MQCDELKLAEVDVSSSRLLMPIDSTSQGLEQARRLLGEKKYYEANLALKSTEDKLRVDTVSLDEAPKSGAMAAGKK